MNLFFVTRDGRIVTPELTGTILEGVTRDSILQLAEDLGLRGRGARIAIDEWREGAPRRDHRGLRVRHGRRRHAGRPARAGDGGRGDHRNGDGRRGHRAHPRALARHPVRPRRGPPRLDDPARLSARAHRRSRQRRTRTVTVAVTHTVPGVPSGPGADLVAERVGADEPEPGQVRDAGPTERHREAVARLGHPQRGRHETVAGVDVVAEHVDEHEPGREAERLGCVVTGLDAGGGHLDRTDLARPLPTA